MEKLLEDILNNKSAGLSYEKAKKWDFDTLTGRDAKELACLGKIVKVKHPVTGHVYYVGVDYVEDFFRSLADEMISKAKR